MPPILYCLLIPLLSLLLTSLALRLFIPFLARKKLGQPILEIGPGWHKSKEGTPTMGGAVFMLSIPLFALLGSYALKKEMPSALVFVLVYALLNGLCGVIDDLSKLKNNKNQGLLPWQKLAWQSASALVFLWLYQTNAGNPFPIFIPFTSLFLNGVLLTNLLFMLLLVGTVNFVNLTDGIDGLVGSVSFIIAVFFSVEGYLMGSASLFALGLSLGGCMIGFLFFNRHPARIFMGDTGSLFLGALTVGGALLYEKPLSVSVFGIVYFLEGLSVVLQVLFYKKKKKRLFLMAPFHHHLEKKGWREEKIVYLFVFITVAAVALAHFS